MADDDRLATPPAAQAAPPHARRPRWPLIAAWWAHSDTASEPELGYESAQPRALDGSVPEGDDPAAY